MEEKKIITLDVTGCKYLERFIRELKRHLIFPISMEKTGMRFGIYYEVSVMQIR